VAEHRGSVQEWVQRLCCQRALFLHPRLRPSTSMNREFMITFKI